MSAPNPLPDPSGAIHSALANVPRVTEGRGVTLAVPASKASEGELRNILTALQNPPAKADLVATWVTVVAGLGSISKGLKDAFKDGNFTLGVFDLALVLVGAVSVGVAGYRYLDARKKPQPFHDRAIEDVRKLIAEATLSAGSGAAGSASAAAVAGPPP